MRIIIIGNSAAAVGAIESLRQYDEACELVAIAEEHHAIYSRPMLSHFLAGEVDRTRLAYRPADFYSRHSVRPILDARVIAIDVDAHAVQTAAGQSYQYDRLLIATGGSPIVLSVAGVDSRGVFRFSRLDDALGILRHLEEHPTERAVVVGGGMIGIKATDALMKRGLRVTLVELAPRILSAALDETASDLMTRLLVDAGVEVLTESTVAAAHVTEGHIAGVTLSSGRDLPCGLLVFGIGVRPNADLARQAGIAVNRGIVVDAFMRTSAPDVYAAGDVAEAYDLVVDMNRTVAIWPNAYRQGAIAGAHMVGLQRADPGGIAMNTVEVCGVPAMSIGNATAEGDGYEIMRVLPNSPELGTRPVVYKRLVLAGDRLVGAILVGNISRAGIYTGLIRNKLDVGAYRKGLMSEHMSLLSLPTHYRKHIVTGAGIEV